MYLQAQSILGVAISKFQNFLVLCSINQPQCWKHYLFTTRGICKQDQRELCVAFPGTPSWFKHTSHIQRSSLFADGL